MSESFFREEPEPQESQVPPEAETSLDDAAQPVDGELQTADDHLAAVMSYVPFLCFVPLMNANWRDNKKARFHARQGVLLFLVELVAFLFLIDDLAKFFFRAVLILTAALALAGIYFAWHGRTFRLPFLSDLADKSKF